MFLQPLSPSWIRGLPCMCFFPFLSLIQRHSALLCDQEKKNLTGAGKFWWQKLKCFSVVIFFSHFFFAGWWLPRERPIWRRRDIGNRGVVHLKREGGPCWFCVWNVCKINFGVRASCYYLLAFLVDQSHIADLQACVISANCWLYHTYASHNFYIL